MHISKRELYFMIACLIGLAILGIAGNMSYHDERVERNFYCEMVKAGAWPDYKHIYAAECPVRHPKPQPRRAGRS